MGQNREERFPSEVHAEFRSAPSGDVLPWGSPDKRRRLTARLPAPVSPPLPWSCTGPAPSRGTPRDAHRSGLLSSLQFIAAQQNSHAAQLRSEGLLGREAQEENGTCQCAERRPVTAALDLAGEFVL